ncbi:MAG: ABC transporter ATP-binding protein [Lachnospiraceae bacterium]|nr:ABC transporter ATP-binding protein [Lachnospiraceae bacterium]
MKLSLNDLTKKFGTFSAVDGLDFTMESGVYGLLGINGAGKTTLLRMICTLLRPTSGTITYHGKDIFALKESYRKEIGYLPQEFGYYPDLSVFDYMMYIASIKGLRQAYAKKRIKELLEQVGMENRMKVKMRKLSGGMIRRVGIAQAMLNNPKILVLDEPTAGLDPNERIRFRNLISELSEDRLVLLSTHIVSDVEFIAKEIILMNQGKFFFTGTSEEIIASISRKVWIFKVPKEDMEKYSKNYLVANVKSLSEGVELRILADQSPDISARQEQATLEDAFLYYFGERAGAGE